MFPISWYLYTFVLLALGGMLLKINLNDADDESRHLDKFWVVYAWAAFALLSYWYFSDAALNANVYLVLGVSAVVMFYLGWLLFEPIKTTYYDDPEEDDDDVDENLSASKKLTKHTLAVAAAGERLVDLDCYGKTTDPQEAGKAIAAMFKPGADQNDAAEALQVLSGNAEDDDDSSGTGLVELMLMWVMVGPAIYYAYELFKQALVSLL